MEEELFTKGFYYGFFAGLSVILGFVIGIMYT